MVNHFSSEPNYAVPPGETLLDTLEELGMTQSDLAKRMGRPVKTINEIIKGKAAITAETSLELERATGIPAGMWNNLERNYRDQLARLKERARLENQTHFLKNIPLKEIIHRGWVEKYKDEVDQLIEVLKFYRISNVDAWETIWGPKLNASTSYRKATTFRSEDGALTAWLRQGEIEAEGISCKPFDKTAFKQLLKEDIRKLTCEADPQKFIPELIRLCSEVGVAVVIVKELPKSRVSGATYWLGPDKAVIQLSVRYKSDDHLWFTFFHEAGHIVLHGKKDSFVEFIGSQADDIEEKEREADLFSSNTLIPQQEFSNFKKTSYLSYQTVSAFSKKIGVAPGIVVGRLQHEGLLPYTHLNKLKVRYTWNE